jgi:hypothetical protein
MVTTIRRAKLHYDGMLDLQGVPREAHWDRVSTAIRRLDDERGRPWHLKLLIQDTPEEAAVLHGLVAELGHAGLVYDFVREPGGGQGVIITPRQNAGTRTRAPVAALAAA